MANDTINAEVANLAAADKISLTHARQAARDFEQWARSQPLAEAGATGQVKRGFGLGTLLKLGALALALFKKLSALAQGAAVVQTFTLLGRARWIAIGTGTPPTIPGAQ